MPADPVIRRCNCTICAMKGVVMLDVPIADCEITAGEDALTLYTFGKDEWLELNLFEDIEDAQLLATQWQPEFDS